MADHHVDEWRIYTNQKRGQNEGSITKRKDGTYMVQISISGKRITRYFKHKKEANDWRLESVNKTRKGIYSIDAQVTLSQFLDHWLSTKETNVRKKTLLQYGQIVNGHINPILGMIKLVDLRPDTIEEFYRLEKERGVGFRTINLTHSVLRCALNKALKEEIIYRNPCDAVDKPKVARHEMNVLDEFQVRRLLSSARGTRLEVLLQIAVTTGLREGEILGLKWRDVDWGNKQIHIQRQLQRIPKVGLVFSEPKSAAGKRMISLGDNSVYLLMKQEKIQYYEKEFFRLRWQENDLIFTSLNGSPMDPRNLLRQYKLLLKKAGLPNIRFHDLRHTAASLMLQQGIPAKVVQERLGHSDISLTLNTYSHVMPGMQEEAAKRMDEITTIYEVDKDTTVSYPRSNNDNPGCSKVAVKEESSQYL